jgi:hypothetical protein
LDEAAPKAIGDEKGCTPISAGGDELEFPSTVNAVVEAHGGGEYTRAGQRSEENVPSGDRRHQTSGVCASRRGRHQVGVVPANG